LLGDAWGPAAASSTTLIQDAPGALQDINIVIPQKLSIDASGYFSAANNLTLTANSVSNQALVVFFKRRAIDQFLPARGCARYGARRVVGGNLGNDV
jgi:hypothetical protein